MGTIDPAYEILEGSALRDTANKSGGVPCRTALEHFMCQCKRGIISCLIAVSYQVF